MTTSSGSLIDSAGRSRHPDAVDDELRRALEEIEDMLLASGLVVGAAVTAHVGPQGDRILVAHVVPRAPADFRPALLQEILQDTLPGCPLPSRFVALDALPLGADGEVDRDALVEAQPQSGVFSTAAMIAAAYDPLTAQLAAIWADILGVAMVLPEDDFFALGGDSLHAARLVLQIADIYRVQFPLRALHEARTLRACALVIQRAQGGEAAPGGPGGRPETWQADARLPADIVATIEATAARERAAADAWCFGEVFLTGATGFVGAFLLRQLLASTAASVHCLVRADDPTSAMLRVRESLARYGLWQEVFARRIHVVVGDLRQPRFGLDEATFEALAYMVDAVFHCGAHVDLVAPYVAHRATNVGGTAEVLRLAAMGLPKPVHHVSSIAVFGPSGLLGGDRRIHEDDDLEAYLPYLCFSAGHAVSKWVAEQMVWEAGRAGLPVTVYRPGYIVGDGRTGASDRDGFLGRVVRGAIQIGAYPDLPRQRMEFVPVDYVSRAIVHIARSPSHQGRAHHLVPTDSRQSIDLNDFFALIGGLGYRLSRYTYRQWVEAVLQDARERDSPLAPLLPLLSERVYKDELTRWELHEDTPDYDAANALWALSGSDVTFRPVDRAAVARYLRRWLVTRRPSAPMAMAVPRGEHLLAGR